MLVAILLFLGMILLLFRLFSKPPKKTSQQPESSPKLEPDKEKFMFLKAQISSDYQSAFGTTLGLNKLHEIFVYRCDNEHYYDKMDRPAGTDHVLPKIFDYNALDRVYLTLKEQEELAKKHSNDNTFTEIDMYNMLIQLGYMEVLALANIHHTKPYNMYSMWQRMKIGERYFRAAQKLDSEYSEATSQATIALWYIERWQTDAIKRKYSDAIQATQGHDFVDSQL